MGASDAFTRKVAHVFTGMASVQLASLVTAIVLARILDVASYGAYRQLIVVNQLISVAVFASLPSSLLVHGGRTAVGERTVSKVAVLRDHQRLAMRLGIAAALVVAVGAPVIARLLGNQTLAASLRIFSLYPVSVMAYSLAASAFVLVERTGVVSRLYPLVAALNSLPVIVAASLGASVPVLAAAMVAGVGLSAVLVNVRLERELATIGVFSEGAGVGVRDLLAFNGPLLLASGLTILGQRLDQLLVSREVGIAVYAVYAAGAFEIPFLATLQSSATSVLMPLLSRAVETSDWSEVRSQWRLAVVSTASFAFPVAATICAFAPEVVEALYGARYSSAAPVMAVYMLLVSVRVVSWGAIARSAGRTNADVLGALVFLGVASVAIPLLLHRFGVFGAAAGVVVATGAVAVVMSRYTVRISRGAMRMRDLYPPAVALAGLANLGVCFLAAFAARSSDDALVRYGVAAGCAVLGVAFWRRALVPRLAVASRGAV